MHAKPRRNCVLALTSIASLLVALDTLVVSTALTAIRLDLGASIEELEWTVNAYNLSLAVLLLPAAALAQFLQTGLGYGAPIAGKLADRIGDRPLLVGGLVLQALGLAWIGLIAAPDLAYSELILPLVNTGVGASLAIPPAASAVVGAVAHDEVGKAAGANGMLRELGGVFGIAIAVAVFAAAGSYGSAQAFTDRFASAIGVAAALSLLGAVGGLWVPRRSPT